jgi:ribosomal protein S18 acetylase RimI-like enzyme
VEERNTRNDLIIRQAVVEDLDALARLHVLVWRNTYRSLAPVSAYDALDESKRRTHWEELLHRDPAQWQTLLAVHDGRLVGFGHAGPASHEVMAGAGEIVHLYVDPSSQGQGIGKTLLHQLMNFLQATGHSTIKLAVVQGNDRAVSFYEQEGGRVIDEFIDGVLWRSQNIVIEFPARTGNGLSDIR